MTESSFAAFVPQAVMDQIAAREYKFGKQNHTAEELEVIHGNTVWCLLRSGVNTPKNEADRFIMLKPSQSVETSSEYAIAGVLGGDQLQSSGAGKRAGVQLINDSSVTFYNKTEKGHRPRPGITGFTVKTLDTWGMILEANINIKVWSRDDLDRMDLLYFKPGFPAIFEWGHSLYFRPDGSICKNPSPAISNEEFFRGGEFGALDDRVYMERQHDCNRETVFGYITNFSWSFNQDGSFDCTLKILSKGSVLESLKVGSNKEAGEDTKQDDEDWWNVSDYHRLLKALNERYGKGSSVIPAVGETPEEPVSKFLQSLYPRSVIQESSDLRIVSVKQALEQSKNTDWHVSSNGLWENMVDCPAVAVPVTRKGRKSGVKCFYMTLETLCNIINHFQKPQAPYFKLETRSEAVYGHAKVYGYQDTDKNPLEMPSLNPVLAIKQGQASEAVEKYSVHKIKNSGFKKCTESYKDLSKRSNRILDIWVNYNMFVSLIEQQIIASNDYGLEPVMREFLNQIQKAFGNVNYFDLHGDAAFTGCFEIVDRTQIRRDQDVERVPVLNVSGLYNTVTDLKITSDISQDLVNEMCIAATAPRESEPGAENADECLVFWGENCRARWYNEPKPNKDTDDSKNKKSEADVRKEFLEKLQKFYSKLQKGNLGTVKGENVEATDNLVSSVQDQVVQFQVDGERYYKNQVKRDIENRVELHMGLIPYKMTLTMLGISRLYIGNTFKIRNGILPKKYDNWGYIITGIEHTVKNNQWFTTITTNYYPVFSNEKQTMTQGSMEDYYQERQEAQKPIPGNVDEIDSACGYREAFLASGIDYVPGKYNGLCARYTVNWARTYVLGKSIPEKGAQYYKNSGVKVPVLSAGGNANQPGYWATLTSLGYKQGRTIGMKMSDIGTLKGGYRVDGTTIKEGDVLVYWNSSGTRFHTCFYDGTRWCSDTDQNTASVYKTDEIFNLILFSSPKRHSDWSCGAGA